VWRRYRVMLEYLSGKFEGFLVEFHLKSSNNKSEEYNLIWVDANKV
jgi:hypothetical protein